MGQKLLPKMAGGHILRPSLAPLTIKVSQVEMEAGDCEGRSASAFFSRQLSVVSSQLYSTRLLATFFNQAEIN